MTTQTTPQLFHCLKYSDARAAIAFLTAVGFREVACYADETDPATVHHCELSWRENGGVMLGSLEGGLEALREGRAHSAYLVVEGDDDVDAFHAAALAAGATSIREPSNPDHGGREATVADAEGHLWSVGSYAGAAGAAGA